MTTVTRTTSRPSRRMPGPRWVEAGVWQAMGHWGILGGFLIVVVVVVAVITTLVSRSTTPTLSGLQYPMQAVMWIPFGVAIHFATSWLGPHVAAGMTRRSFVRAAVTGVALVAVSAAVVVMLLLRLERWVYGLLGWTAGTDPGRLSGAEAPVVPYLWGLFLLVAVAGLTGLVVGLTYARLGPLATFLLPLTLSPLAAVAALALDPATMFVPFLAWSAEDGELLWSPPTLGLGGGPASLVIGTVILAVTLYAVHLLARRIPIRTRRG